MKKKNTSRPNPAKTTIAISTTTCSRMRINPFMCLQPPCDSFPMTTRIPYEATGANDPVRDLVHHSRSKGNAHTIQGTKRCHTESVAAQHARTALTLREQETPYKRYKREQRVKRLEAERQCDGAFDGPETAGVFLFGGCVDLDQGQESCCSQFYPCIGGASTIRRHLAKLYGGAPGPPSPLTSHYSH